MSAEVFIGIHLLISLGNPIESSFSFFGFFLSLNLFIFNWRIIALQYCVDFCHIST